MLRFLPFLALLIAGCNSGRGTTPTQPSTPDLDYPVGSFSLTERSGKTITDKDLRGKVWVASFVFTRCTGPCPAVTRTVAQLQSELTEADVRFVTFTMDPTRDDPNELKKYAEIYRADPERWLFLTGDEKTIHKMMVEQFKQAVEKKLGPDVKPGDEYGHSTRLLVVDKAGVIRATFDGVLNERLPEPEQKPAFEKNLTALKEKVRALLK
jgi:cytochrome oxidase Cu insertion factor (SCO1/SenC/PrrC family)